ncbi:hypothetical protein [Herpetosiphon gulosus]|uniref:Uncharacterized protein n=1 Tax=Herpetosiphon gulosus TaxID=1973496 RepID=A0ABP9WYA9_9CHLR
MIVYQTTLEQIRSIIKAQANFDIIDSIYIQNIELAAINAIQLPIIRQIMQTHSINLNGLYLFKPIHLFTPSINFDQLAESSLLAQPINRPNTIIDKQGIDYTIWLESEASTEEFHAQFNNTLDAINMSVIFVDGDEFAFTVETFDFFYLQLNNADEIDLFEAPDILISSLDRPTIELMVADMIKHQQFDDRFLSSVI